MKIKTTKVIALRDLYYDGDRKEGEKFDVSEKYLELLLRTGAVALDDGKSGDGRYARRDMRAEA